MTDGPKNVADYLPEMAAERPDATAMYVPRPRRVSGKREYTEVSYRTLNARSSRIAAGLLSDTPEGRLSVGTRVAVMVKPGEDFFVIMFGLFKAGLVPVLVDPGLGMKNLGSCLERAQPQAFIGIPLAQAARVVLGLGRKSVTRVITVGRRWLWGGETLRAVESVGEEALVDGVPLPTVSPDDMAAILFTSGSTGPPKGVVYTHRNFTAQVEALRKMFDIRRGEVNLPTFPPFALFDPALGVTSVIPFMDPTRPAEVDPREIAEPVNRFGVTMMFGSPALLNTVGRWAEANGTTLPSLRRVIAAGAPLPGPTIVRWQSILSAEARLYPPYGATESLPIACLPSDEIVNDTWPQTEQGKGVCIGRPVESIEVAIIAITDDAIERWSDATPVAEGEVGEICVKGPMVTEAYYDAPLHTALAKIRSDDAADGANGGGVWHRMGDLGWRDSKGRLWFCGRKSHRIRMHDHDVFTVPLEKIFDRHPAVFRCAIVRDEYLGEEVPALVVELEADAKETDYDTLKRELWALGEIHPDTEHIVGLTIHPGFPVDIRHNAKIGREQLATWLSELRIR